MHPVTLQNKTIIKVLVLLAIIFSNTDGLASVDALIKKHQIPENKLSIILEDSESGERLISINPSTTRSPGSVTKIFTAFAALDLLGEAYQWRTDAFIEKENNNKEIVDHLLIRGGGDPSFSLKDLEKLKFIKNEHSILKDQLKKNIKTDDKLNNLYQSLKKINAKLWVIEDDKRQCEKDKNFGEKFIKLSRDVHFLNDDRSKIKLEINNHTGSVIKEIKEYTAY